MDKEHLSVIAASMAMAASIIGPIAARQITLQSNTLHEDGVRIYHEHSIIDEVYRAEGVRVKVQESSCLVEIAGELLTWAPGRQKGDQLRNTEQKLENMIAIDGSKQERAAVFRRTQEKCQWPKGMSAMQYSGQASFY